METTNLINSQVEETKVSERAVDMDLDLSATRKKRIRIDGDDNRIIEINTSDMNIIQRLDVLSDRMNKLSDKFIDIKFGNEPEGEEPSIEDTEEAIRVIDRELRDIIDELFQSKVSDICAPDGTMWDMFNGSFRYEIIMEQLLNLYADNIQAETKKTMERLHKYTDKYMPTDHLKKRK